MLFTNLLVGLSDLGNVYIFTSPIITVGAVGSLESSVHCNLSTVYTYIFLYTLLFYCQKENPAVLPQIKPIPLNGRLCRGVNVSTFVLRLLILA